MVKEIDLLSHAHTDDVESVENGIQSLPYVPNLDFCKHVCGLHRLLSFACLCLRVHIKKTIAMHFITPVKSRSIQAPRKEECLQQFAQCRGAQRAIVLIKG